LGPGADRGGPARTLGICKVNKGGALHRRRRLWSERYAVLSLPECVGPSGSVDLERFLSTPQAILSSREGNCRLVDEALEQRGLSRHAVVTTPHLFAIPYLVRTTGVVATVPESVAQLLASLFGLAVSPPPLEISSMVWHVFYHRDTAHAWLRARVLEALFSERESALSDSSLFSLRSQKAK